MKDPHLKIREYYSQLIKKPQIDNQQELESRWYEAKEHLIFKTDGNKRVFETGSQRDNDTNKSLPNHLDAYVRMRYGYLLRHGANHYDKGNWRKGQPTEAALESLHRHLAKFEINYYNGVEQDEDHLSAIIFGVQLIMKNEEKEGINVDHYYKPI